VSLFQRKHYQLGIAADHLALLHVGANRTQDKSLLAEMPFSASFKQPQTMLEAVEQLFTSHSLAGSRVEVIIADAWARYWLVDPPTNVASLAELKTCCEARFEHLFGDAVTDWQVIADWQAANTFLAAAIPAWLLNGLMNVCRQHDVKLGSCVPLFIQYWNHLNSRLPTDLWLCTEHAGTLILALVLNGRLRTIRTLTAPHKLTDSELLATIERESLRVASEEIRPLPTSIYHVGPELRQSSDATHGPLQLINLNKVSSPQNAAASTPHSRPSGDSWLVLAGSPSW